MDATSLIQIVVAVIVVYFLVKFIISPVIRAVVGIIVFLLLLYVLQRYFGFDFEKVLAPFGISLNLDGWEAGFNWIFGPLNYYLDQIKKFLTLIWANFPKN